MARRTRWVLEWVDESRCDVVQNGRRLRSNVSWTEAGQYLREKSKHGDSILREEKDGYRVPVRLSTLR